MAASASEAAAFAEIYRRHAAGVYAWLRGRLDWAATDLTAETFAQAWLCRRRFRDERAGTALPWLLGIAHNVLRASVRQDRIERRARERLGLPLELGADDAYDAVDERLSPQLPLADALASLPPHERDALALRVVDELPYDAVAKRLEIRPAAARLRVSRALRRLSLATPKEDL